MKREAGIVIASLTSWILTVFSIFVPWWHRAEVGTARRLSKGPQFRLDYNLTPRNFFPTSENSFSFLPRPTTYDLLPTPHLGAFPKTDTFVRTRQLLVRPLHALVRTGRALVRPRRGLVRTLADFCPLQETFRPQLTLSWSWLMAAVSRG